MRFSFIRLSVTQLRILVLALNLMLGAGVLGYAAYSYYGVYQTEKETTQLVPHAGFEYRPGEANVGNPNSPGRLSIVASWLSPPKKTVVDDSLGAEGEGEKEKEGSGDAAEEASVKEPGPLDENWEYVAYILREDPLQNWVKLQKKEVVPTLPNRPGVSAQMNVRRSVTTRPRTVGGVNRPAQPSNSISFFVADRTYTIPEAVSGGDPTTFYIHDANGKELVYWMPGDPKKFFYLPFQDKSPYYATAKNKRHLAPPPQPPPPDGALAEAKPQPKFIDVPSDMEDVREREYKDLLEGKTLGPVLKQAQDSAQQAGTQPAGALQAPVRPLGARLPSGGLTAPPPGTSVGAPKPMTEAEKREGMRKIQEIMKSDKMKPEDRAALQKALRGPAK